MLQIKKEKGEKMKTKLLASLFVGLLFAGIITAGMNISRVSATPTTIYIDPSNVAKAPADVGNTFDVSVKISDVTDLFGFDIKITWDNTLITLSSLDNTTLSAVFVIWFEPLTPHYQTGVGYVRFAAVKTGSPPGFTGSGTLFTLTFNVVKSDNFPHSTSIAFDTVKLSDSGANEITATKTPCSYTMSATVPDIDFVLVDPNLAKPYEYGKYFKVEVYATHVTSLTDYDLKVDYTSELLMFNYEWITWSGFGTGLVDNATAGVVHASILSGGPYTGDRVLLFTLTFKVAFDVSITHIWRNLSPHSIDAAVSLDATYGDLSFTGGTIPVTGITILHSPLTVTINLIQGDVDCNGKVDVFDLRTVAAYYDTSAPTGSPQEKFDVKTEGTIDIFDLVVVATNFGYYKPDSFP
jgi:hypothetical protein